MLIKAEKEQIKAVYPADADGTKACLSAVRADLPDFAHDGGVFRTDTARYAAALAMSAVKEEMLRENLTALGMKSIVFLSFDGADENRIGMAMGCRGASYDTTVTVVLRPTAGREWFSDFDVGYGSEHIGFLRAAEYAEQRLADYLYVRRLRTEPRFLVTGYSRGGAVANLLSKRLCDRFGVDAVRCYTFASPNTCVSVSGACYGSIFNLVRDEDFFTRVPLTGWGYTRYGSTLSLSGCGDIRKRFAQLSGTDYIGFTSPRETDAFLCALMRLAPNVHAYCERRYPVGGRSMSLRDYMMTIAALLAREEEENAADILLDATVSEFAQLSDFLMSGMDVTAILSPAEGTPRCSVADSHSPAAYMAALQLYRG